MKNYLMLLTGLMLAACGGGSGGGHIDAPVSVERSNARITTMKSNSEYQVAQFVANKLGDDVTSVNVARRTISNKPIDSNINMDYATARELIELAGTLANESTSAEDIVALFNNDKNKIRAALKLIDNAQLFNANDAETTATQIISHRAGFATPLAKLKEKTEIFNLHDVNFKTMITPHQVDTMKFTVDAQGKIDGIVFAAADGHELAHVPANWLNKIARTDDDVFQTSNATMKYDSYAKSLGLKYTDFGAIGIDYNVDGARGHFDAPFIAGYEQKRITDMPNGETVFVGTARGTVEYAADTNAHLPIQDTNAKLTFNNDSGTETLKADFENWYGVSITKDGDVVTMNLETQHTTDNRFILTQTNKTYDYFDAAYYGDNNTPTEATALFQYQEKINPDLEVTDNNKTVYIGFGGKTE